MVRRVYLFLPHGFATTYRREVNISLSIISALLPNEDCNLVLLTSALLPNEDHSLILLILSLLLTS